jgi:hypothetical protein
MSEKRGRGRSEFEPIEDSAQEGQDIGRARIAAQGNLRLTRTRCGSISRKRIEMGAAELKVQLGNFALATIMGTEVPSPARRAASLAAATAALARRSSLRAPVR